MTILLSILSTRNITRAVVLLFSSLSLISCAEQVHTPLYTKYPTVSPMVLPTEVPEVTSQEHIPEAIKTLLMALPEDQYTPPKSLRKAYLESPLHIANIPGYGPSMDKLIIAGVKNNHFSIWLRSFATDNQQATIYLVVFSEKCNHLLAYKQALPPVCKDVIRPEYVRFVSPLRAFYLTDNQEAKEVTNTILPPHPLAILSPKEKEQYNPQHTKTGQHFYRVYMDASKLGQVPVFRWIIDYDVEQPIPADSDKAYNEGLSAHLGFVVWDGQKFAVKQYLPRSLWPCRTTPIDKPRCYYERLEENDPFILQ